MRISEKILAAFLLALLTGSASADEIAVSSAAASPPVAVSTAAGQSFNGYVYERPGGLDFLKKAPRDLAEYGRTTFKRKNLGWMAAIAGSTAVLLIADQWLVDKSRNLGDHLGITHTQYQKKFVRVKVGGGAEFRLEGPFDSGSALYFIGDGWTQTALATSFLTYGFAKNDSRALQTASQMAESILASGAVVQALKHATGRESPFTTNHPRGNWRFFENISEYHRDVPKHDAFPSGHLAATMAAVTVISDNYPEKRFIRPLGYTLMTVLGFQMMNNGVHWPSDYPLGLALGYGFGKIAVRNGRRREGDGEKVELSPLFLEGGAGARAAWRFGKDDEHES